MVLLPVSSDRPLNVAVVNNLSHRTAVVLAVESTQERVCKMRMKKKKRTKLVVETLIMTWLGKERVVIVTSNRKLLLF